MQIATFDEIKACVEIARLKKTYVAAHCHGTEAVKNAIRAGVRTIEHAVFIDEEGIEMLKGAEDTYLVATGAISMYCLDNDNGEVSRELLEKIAEICGERKKLHQQGLSRGT